MANYIKKITVMIFMLFFCTGCYTEYNLNISDYNIDEEIRIIENNQTVLNNYATNSFRDYINRLNNSETSAIYTQDQNFFETGLEYEGYRPYEKSLIQQNGYGMSLKYSYTLSDYFIGTAINNCYDESSFKKEDDIFYITTGNEFKCLNSFLKNEKVTVNIKTDYQVFYHNADEILSDGTMVWNINNSNYNNKPILLNFKYGYDYEIIGDEEEDNYSEIKITHDVPSANNDVTSSIQQQESIDTGSSTNAIDNASRFTESYSRLIESTQKGNNLLQIIFYIICFGIAIVVACLYYRFKKSK